MAFFRTLPFVTTRRLDYSYRMRKVKRRSFGTGYRRRKSKPLRYLLGMLALGVAICVFFTVRESRFLDDNLVPYTVPMSIVTGRTDSDTLVVLLHGFAQPRTSVDGVKNALASLELKERKSFDVIQPDLPLGPMSIASHFDITAELVSAVDRAWEKKLRRGPAYREIIFVGHSFGAMLARKLFVVAKGEQAAAKFEPGLKAAIEKIGAQPIGEPRPWAGKVSHVILLAGMNRGWSISHHMSLRRALFMQTGVAYAYVVEFFTGRLPVIMSLRRGAPFITQLRLQWLAMEQAQAAAGGDHNYVTVQLLGTIDDLVAPDDNIDLVTGANFVYLEVPGSGHKSIIDLDPGAHQEPAAILAAEARRKVFQTALSATGSTPGNLTPREQRVVADPDVSDLIFIIHGIRDEGHWTKKIARRVTALEQQNPGRKFATETSTYGYFPMLSFLIPGARQEKVEWLMDKYTEAKARYPNAVFHYIGHSHGTYLLAKALQDYPSVTFGNVVFAGSVVRKKFEWHEYIPERISAVQNYVASADWVVAFFPKAFESLNVQDLGSAGHDGFVDVKSGLQVVQASTADLEKPIRTYVIGGHGAALQEQLWDNIARFIVDGENLATPEQLMTSERSRWVAWPSMVAPLLWLVLLALLAGILVLLLKLKIREWIKTVAVIAYLGLIWTVVTKV